VDELRRTFTDIFAALALLEAQGEVLSTVALPLIGAGGMRQPIETLAPVLLQCARDGVRRLTSLRTLKIIERDSGRAHATSRAIDLHLGLPQRSLLESQLFKLIKDDLLSALGAAQSSSESPGLYREFSDALRAESPPPSLLGTCGRKLAERVTTQTGGRGNNLAARIEDLRNREVPRWVVGYLHVLRQFGNEVVHDQRPTGSSGLSNNDLATAMVCALRVLEFQAARRSE